jgi:RIO kinase 1
MEKGTRYGRKAQEEAWQSAEVDALQRLAAAGVRVPRPYNFLDGVLLMELVTGDDGEAAPRLNDVVLSPELAREYHCIMITQVVRMLCAGIIHGDLSEYNVLVGSEGPVIIDLPQAVDSAGNKKSSSMLERDVGNLATYFGQFAPELLDTDYGMEIWSLYQSGKLKPESLLTGRFERNEKPADMAGVMREINDTLREEEARQLYRQQQMEKMKFAG